MNEEQKGLLVLCQTIVYKGKFNEDDVRQISEYINTFPNIAELWPAKILLKPLQQVWADGVLDHTELKSISLLLVDIAHDESLGMAKDKPPVINQLNEPSKSAPIVSLSKDSLGDLINKHKEEQQVALAKVKEAFKVLNKKNASIEDLEDAENLVSLAEEAVSDIIHQCYDRSEIASFAEETVEELCGGEDNDDPSWNEYFDKKPSKGLVKKCAIQARIESKDEADSLGLTIDLIRSELLLK